MKKQKDTKNEVTFDVTSDFNVFECGRIPLNTLDVLYEQAYMANSRDK